MHKETPSSKHLPYRLEPGNRAHFYENYWKHCGLQLLQKHLSDPKNKTVLDYGCGRGEALQIFGHAGFSVTGTDVDPHCVELAGKYGESRILNAADPVAQFGKKSFDVVMCFHVLEHVDNPRQALTALRDIARQYVLIGVPNLRYLHRLFARDIRVEDINPGHLQSWDHWHLLNLAERHCGLKLVEWGFDATILPLISSTTDKIFGQNMTIKLETGLFRKIFPFHGISVIGLFKPEAVK
jgi:SAM-dependent methyltransferase